MPKPNNPELAPARPGTGGGGAAPYGGGRSNFGASSGMGSAGAGGGSGAGAGAGAGMGASASQGFGSMGMQGICPHLYPIYIHVLSAGSRRQVNRKDTLLGMDNIRHK